MYSWILYCHEKKGNAAFCSNMDGSWRYYAKWDKSVRERNTVWYHLNVKLKKTKTKTEFKETVEWWLPAGIGGLGEMLLKGAICNLQVNKSWGSNIQYSYYRQQKLFYKC